MSKRSDINFIMESVYGRAVQSNHIQKSPSSPEPVDDKKDQLIDSYDVTRQPGHLLRKALQHHLAIFQRLSPEPTVTGPQFALLCALRDYGPCSLTEIGRVIVMDPATTRGIVERLQKRGFISFSRDLTDRRQVVVGLEPSGARILRRMIPSAIEVSAATVQNLNPAEQVALRFLLEKMVLSNGAAEPVIDHNSNAHSAKRRSLSGSE